MTREEAKRELMFAKREVMADSYIDKAYDMAIEALSQPKIGKWVEDVAYYAEDGCPCIITRCDQCGEPNPVSKFCPNCGARMEEK